MIGDSAILRNVWLIYIYAMFGTRFLRCLDFEVLLILGNYVLVDLRGSETLGHKGKS